jgi:hypothetical protein
MPGQGPAAFLAGIILPHRAVPGGLMGEICPVSSPIAIGEFALVTDVKLITARSCRC